MNMVDRLTHGTAAPRRTPSAAWVDALTATASIATHPERLLSHVIEARAESCGAAHALLSDRESFTFPELVARADAYACWALELGLKRGSRVALVMSNRPEFFISWLGLTKAGAIVALINTNLTGPHLAHCLKAANVSHVIAERAYETKVVDAARMLDLVQDPLVIFCHGESQSSLPRVDLMVDQLMGRKPHGLPVVTVDDKALLIYTSGTTGLPKAAYVSHRRILNWALWFAGMRGNTEDDRMYNCLPLYHSVGGVVAVVATLVAGGSTVIVEKFSATRFWSDLRRWDCTQFQYIGELCRYLLNVPVKLDDKPHRLRVAVGNGLRADIWETFQGRFDIPQILEFYAATEGNFSLFNAEGKPGTIGRIPSFLRHRFPTAIVRYDPDLGEPLRNSEGFCIKAQTGEAGEAIGRIGDGDGSGQFEGYTDPNDTNRKILRNVFSEGDAWFRTGDLMRNDASGYFYFVDRIGETFRWKGENVSTLEVANALATCPGVMDVTVYGVGIPGADGKAGMAKLDVDPGFLVAALGDLIDTILPSYARPVFLRIGSSLAVTETFKHKKQQLIHEGFDPSCTDDRIYVYQSAARTYVPLHDQLRDAILKGEVRL